VTNNGLKELAPLKNLTALHPPGNVSDGTLRVLREVDLLHALVLPNARGKSPANAALEFFSFNLTGQKEVTDAGLKELARSTCRRPGQDRQTPGRQAFQGLAQGRRRALVAHPHRDSERIRRCVPAADVRLQHVGPAIV
jgi:hypothetical protein